MKVVLLLFVFLFQFANIADASSCNSQVWQEISQKYELEEQFSKMQEVVDTQPFNQTAYDAYEQQYKQSLALAERECSAIGADEADKAKFEQFKLQYSNDQESESDSKSDNTQGYQFDYEYNQQRTCPENAYESGNHCWCNTGYELDVTGLKCVLIQPTPTPIAKPSVAPIVNKAVPTSLPIASELPETDSEITQSVDERLLVNEPKKGILTNFINTIRNLFKIFNRID